MEKPELEEAFGKEALAAGLSGLPGHRSVGGFRASIYNAMDLESIDALVAVMRDFAKKNG
jgi:phosphoserine aminotransferase